MAVINLPTYEQFDMQNALLASIAAHTGTEGIKISSFEDVQRLVRMGLADKVFKVGDQFIANYNSTPITWDIIGIDHDIPTDKKYTKSLTIQPTKCIMDCQWDSPEALYYCAAELPAGVQKFIDGATTYEFTTTVDLEIGSQIVPSAWTSETITQVKTYANASSVDVIETCTVTASTGAATLTPINDKLRTHYGSNEYINSAIRQFLNSTDTTFAWVAKTIYDRKPTAEPYTTGGFLNLLDADLVAVLGAVDKQVARNTVTDGGGQNTFSDKVFLLSTKEVYGANEGTITGEAAYAYYSALAGAASNSAMPGRTKYLAATARNWWLRSPYLTSSCTPRLVNTAGEVNNGGGAYTALGLAPACCIV